MKIKRSGESGHPCLAPLLSRYSIESPFMSGVSAPSLPSCILSSPDSAPSLHSVPPPVAHVSFLPEVSTQEPPSVSEFPCPLSPQRLPASPDPPHKDSPSPSPSAFPINRPRCVFVGCGVVGRTVGGVLLLLVIKSSPGGLNVEWNVSGLGRGQPYSQTNSNLKALFFTVPSAKGIRPEYHPPPLLLSNTCPY